MFPTTQNSITDLSSALAQSKVQDSSNSSSGKAYIKFDYKTGSFAYGRDQEDISGDEIVINTYSFTHGWVLWSNGIPTKVMRSFTEELPPAMPSVGDDSPSEARGFEARFKDDEETVLVFESNSHGGRSGVDALLGKVGLRSAGGETEFLFPVVKLISESYKAAKGGTVHNPVFEIVSWVNVEGKTSEDTPLIEDQAQTEEAPRRKRRV